MELTLTFIWKGAVEGRRGSTRLSQSKETLLELGGGTFEVVGMPAISEDSALEIKQTLLLGTSPLKKGV